MVAAVSVSEDINASAETVWGLITDLAGAPARLSSVTDVQILAGEEFGVGTRWRETRRMFGKQASEEMTITAMEPGRSYSTEALHGSTRYTSTMAVAPAGSGCRLTMTFEGTPGNMVGRLFAATVGKLFEGATKKAIRQDLVEIRAAAEGQP